jgi:DNA-binding MarR family transcriptional regulator
MVERGGDIVIAGPRIAGQQNLRSLELARGVLTSAHKRGELGALGLAQFNPIAYIHLCLLFIRGTDEQLNRMADVSRAGKNFTAKQGQYLAFIHLYTRLHRRPPAETDMQKYFRVSPPSVHQMVLTLERVGFIRRQPRVARSIEMLVDPKCLRELL